MNMKQIILDKTTLGIVLVSTRIKAILIDEKLNTIAKEEHQ